MIRLLWKVSEIEQTQLESSFVLCLCPFHDYPDKFRNQKWPRVKLRCCLQALPCYSNSFQNKINGRMQFYFDLDHLVSFSFLKAEEVCPLWIPTEISRHAVFDCVRLLLSLCRQMQRQTEHILRKLVMKLTPYPTRSLMLSSLVSSQQSCKVKDWESHNIHRRWEGFAPVKP